MILYATAALGTEDLVAKELRGLGFAGVRHSPGAVRFAAGGDPLAAGMRACLWLRVLWPLGRPGRST